MFMFSQISTYKFVLLSAYSNSDHNTKFEGGYFLKKREETKIYPDLFLKFIIKAELMVHEEV